MKKHMQISQLCKSPIWSIHCREKKNKKEASQQWVLISKPVEGSGSNNAEEGSSNTTIIVNTTCQAATQIRIWMLSLQKFWLWHNCKPCSMQWIHGLHHHSSKLHHVLNTLWPQLQNMTSYCVGSLQLLHGVT